MDSSSSRHASSDIIADVSSKSNSIYLCATVVVDKYESCLKLIFTLILIELVPATVGSSLPSIRANFDIHLSTDEEEDDEDNEYLEMSLWELDRILRSASWRKLAGSVHKKISKAYGNK